jgi:AraC family transcriptional regulator of adaptative response / DNA-3-methyladenine glycosylase II
MAPLEDTLAALRAIRGVGEWTVQYIAMRALGWPNAFPEGDAVLMRHLGFSQAATLKQHAAQWAPWRAYATLHVWRLAEQARQGSTGLESDRTATGTT